MAFSKNTEDNEQKKFEENALDGGTDVRVTLKSPVEVEVQPGGSLLSGIEYDEVQVTYPTTSTENYEYKESTITVANVLVTYTDITKRNVQSMVRS
jgi:hypothetical protein